VDDVTRTAIQAIDAPADGARVRASAPGEQLHVLIQQLMTIARASVLEEMASGIAHELNQPLGAIATFAQAGERMLNRPEPMVAGAVEVLQLISKEALGAGEGIRHIRRLFNRDSVQKSPCRMDDLVRELSGVLELLALRSGGRILIDIEPALPVVLADRLRIQHVLFTLVQNAFEAITSRIAHVRILVSGDRYGVEVSVSDNGPGIPSENRAHIFHPFFTTKPQGTGLGLASARAIIEAHEGTIGFENLSEPEQQSGTRFWFRLPSHQESSAT
jgi:two-component system sensor kinase FixL